MCEEFVDFSANLPENLKALAAHAVDFEIPIVMPPFPG